MGRPPHGPTSPVVDAVSNERRWAMTTGVIDGKIEVSLDGRPAVEVEKQPTTVRGARFWGVLRIAMGWTFLWAFLDKAFALGFATGRNPETGAIDFFGPDAWINGGSPTDGFLQFGVHTKGFFADLYGALVGEHRAGPQGPGPEVTGGPAPRGGGTPSRPLVPCQEVR